MRKFMIIALTFMFAVGCAEGIRYTQGEISGFTPEIREHIRKKEVSLGMTQAAVRYSWGAPKAVRYEPEDDKEIWLYSNMRIYVTKLTFVGGKLVGSSSGLSINNPISSYPEKTDEKTVEQSAPDSPSGGNDGGKAAQ